MEFLSQLHRLLLQIVTRGAVLCYAVACVGALVSQRVLVSAHSCPVLGPADNRCCYLLILVLLHLVLLDLSSQSLYTERRARPGFVQRLSLVFRVDTRIILGITGTHHVELVHRIRDALDPLVRYVCFAAIARVYRTLGASFWSVTATSLRLCVVCEPLH